jgi:hypothetical protein
VERCINKIRARRGLAGKPLLTFRQIAAAIGAESEQAARGRYRRKAGNLNPQRPLPRRDANRWISAG